MLDFIRIQRFKSLNDASFPLAALNLFSGLNGMGKSSLIQVLLLLRQSYEKKTFPDRGIFLNGDYVSVGTGRDILAENAEKESIDFTLTWLNEEPVHLAFAYVGVSDFLPLREDSSYLMMDLIDKSDYSRTDHRLWFGQLYGMSDNISYNMAKEGFNVAKYLPFGPVKDVMPYLIRRAEENTSVAGQTNRELELIKAEKKRRKV